MLAIRREGFDPKVSNFERVEGLISKGEAKRFKEDFFTGGFRGEKWGYGGL